MGLDIFSFVKNTQFIEIKGEPIFENWLRHFLTM
jgi:hypothetical protein